MFELTLEEWREMGLLVARKADWLE
jgi:hypothetical protein